jgi:hypothetical protein
MTGASPDGAFPGSAGHAGAAWFATPGSRFNALDFLVRLVIAGKAFCGWAKVLEVQGGGVARPPTVTVQPMVSQADGFGNLVPHGPIYQIPVFRLQGGAAAVFVDPIPGDTGAVIVCHRDSSRVKATGDIAGPGSRRQNAWEDGLYFGAFGGPAPTCWVQVGQNFINMTEPGGAQIIMQSGTIATFGALTNNGVDVSSTHVHGGVQSGGSDTGPPV